MPAAHIRRDAPSGLDFGSGAQTAAPEFHGGFAAASGGYQSTKSKALGARAAGRKAQTIEGVSFAVQPRASKAGQFAIGERVFHQKFGYGQIEDIDADRLEIAFEQAGLKTVIASFVEKT